MANGKLMFDEVQPGNGAETDLGRHRLRVDPEHSPGNEDDEQQGQKPLPYVEALLASCLQLEAESGTRDFPPRGMLCQDPDRGANRIELLPLSAGDVSRRAARRAWRTHSATVVQLRRAKRRISRSSSSPKKTCGPLLIDMSRSDSL